MTTILQSRLHEDQRQVYRDDDITIPPPRGSTSGVQRRRYYNPASTRINVRCTETTILQSRLHEDQRQVYRDDDITIPPPRGSTSGVQRRQYYNPASTRINVRCTEATILQSRLHEDQRQVYRDDNITIPLPRGSTSGAQRRRYYNPASRRINVSNVLYGEFHSISEFAIGQKDITLKQRVGTSEACSDVAYTRVCIPSPE